LTKRSAPAGRFFFAQFEALQSLDANSHVRYELDERACAAAIMETSTKRGLYACHVILRISVWRIVISQIFISQIFGAARCALVRRSDARDNERDGPEEIRHRRYRY
jgi:hypothetical protein